VTGDISSVQGQEEVIGGVIATLIGVFGAGIGIWIASRWFRTFPIFQRLVLSSELQSSMAMRRTRGRSIIEAMGSPKAMGGIQKGHEGIAHTDLRPAGRGMFDGKMVDVQSDGSYISKGARIRVVNVGRYVIDVEETGT
jgi:membrane-bound serine protease (ClpP class)